MPEQWDCSVAIGTIFDEHGEKEEAKSKSNLEECPYSLQDYLDSFLHHINGYLQKSDIYLSFDRSVLEQFTVKTMMSPLSVSMAL